MIKDRRERKLSIFALCISVLCLSIAYASLTQSLNITGNTVVTGNGWDIAFVGPISVNKTGNAEATSDNVSLNSTNVTINNIKLLAPGDKVEVLFNVKNNGGINAKLSTITNLTPTFSGIGDIESSQSDESLVEDNYEYSFQCYDKDSLIYKSCSTDSLLSAGEILPVKVIIDFKSSAVSSPTADVIVSNFGTTLIYVQD